MAVFANNSDKPNEKHLNTLFLLQLALQEFSTLELQGCFFNARQVGSYLYEITLQWFLRTFFFLNKRTFLRIVFRI